MCLSRPSVRAADPILAMSRIPEAGEVPRRPNDVAPSEIRDFAYTMIRVLDEKGEAVGEWAVRKYARATRAAGA